jgi:hypothetical protein
MFLQLSESQGGIQEKYGGIRRFLDKFSPSTRAGFSPNLLSFLTKKLAQSHHFPIKNRQFRTFFAQLWRKLYGFLTQFCSVKIQDNETLLFFNGGWRGACGVRR